MEQHVFMEVDILPTDAVNGALLSVEDRVNLRSELLADIAFEWAQPKRPRPGWLDQQKYQQQHAEAAVLFIVVLSASPLGKKFQELIAEDVWKGLKGLVSRILKRQEEVVYAIMSFPYIVLESADCTIVLGLAPLKAYDKNRSLGDLADAQEEALRWYDKHWAEVSAEVERCRSGPFDYEYLAKRTIFAVDRDLRREGGRLLHPEGFRVEPIRSLDELSGARLRY